MQNQNQLSWFKRPKLDHIKKHRPKGNALAVLDYLCANMRVVDGIHVVPPLTITVKQHQYVNTRRRLADKLGITKSMFDRAISCLAKNNLIFTQEITIGNKKLATIFSVNFDKKSEATRHTDFVLKIDLVKKKVKPHGKKVKPHGKKSEATRHEADNQNYAQVSNSTEKVSKNVEIKHDINKKDTVVSGQKNELSTVKKGGEKGGLKIKSEATREKKRSHHSKESKLSKKNKEELSYCYMLGINENFLEKSIKKEESEVNVYNRISWGDETLRKEFKKFLKDYAKAYPYKISDKSYYEKIFNSPNITQKYKIQNLLFWRGYMLSKPDAKYAKNFKTLIETEVTPEGVEAGYKFYRKTTKKSEFANSAMAQIQKEKDELDYQETQYRNGVKYWDHLKSSNPSEARIIENKALKLAGGCAGALQQKFSNSSAIKPSDRKLILGCVLTILEQDPKHHSKIKEMS